MDVFYGVNISTEYSSIFLKLVLFVYVKILMGTFAETVFVDYRLSFAN
jgi:hypothetical protein